MFSKKNSASAKAYADKKKMQMERARQLKEERKHKLGDSPDLLDDFVARTTNSGGGDGINEPPRENGYGGFGSVMNSGREGNVPQSNLRQPGFSQERRGQFHASHAPPQQRNEDVLDTLVREKASPRRGGRRGNDHIDHAPLSPRQNENAGGYAAQHRSKGRVAGNVHAENRTPTSFEDPYSHQNGYGSYDSNNYNEAQPPPQQQVPQQQVAQKGSAGRRRQPQRQPKRPEWNNDIYEPVSPAMSGTPEEGRSVASTASGDKPSWLTDMSRGGSGGSGDAPADDPGYKPSSLSLLKQKMNKNRKPTRAPPQRKAAPPPEPEPQPPPAAQPTNYRNKEDANAAFAREQEMYRQQLQGGGQKFGGFEENEPPAYRPDANREKQQRREKPVARKREPPPKKEPKSARGPPQRPPPQQNHGSQSVGNTPRNGPLDDVPLYAVQNVESNPPMFADDPVPLRPCPECGRKFREDRIGKHVDACRKAQKTRKVFDVSKKRAEGTELEQFKRENQPARGGRGARKPAQSRRQEPAMPANKVPKWKQQHEQFQAMLQRNKEIKKAEAAGMDIRDIPMAPPTVDESLIPCPTCGRRFNEKAAERHIPKCKDIIAKPKALAKGSGVAAGAGGARGGARRR